MILIKQEPRLDISYLFFSGIQTEKSTHRVHIDLQGKRLYIFETQKGIDALPEPIEPKELGDWESYCGYQLKSYGRYKDRKLATARGIRVRYGEVSGCQEIIIPDEIIIPEEIQGDNREKLGTSEKGKMAENVAAKMFSLKLVPIMSAINLVRDRHDQLSGIDADAKIHIQIKCDSYCSQWGLFLQTHEWNPDKCH